MKSVEISIIIPNYNNKKYLADCLDSVLRQSFKDIEIIVTDDCSTDGSGELINYYVERYPEIIKALFHEKNLGISRNRHRGIMASHGKYITTLDSDDMYDDVKKLEQEYCLLKKHESNEGKDVVTFSNVKLLFNDLSEHVVGSAENIREGDIFHSILLRSSFIPRDFLFKKEMYFQVGGYNPCYKIYEDWNLKLKLAQHYSFFYTGLNGIIYRRHGQGLSAYGADMHLKYLRKSFYEAVFSIKETETIRTYKQEFEKKLIDFFKKSYKKESTYQKLMFMMKCVIHGRSISRNRRWERFLKSILKR